MATAPDTPTYLLLNQDTTDLPNSLTLTMGNGLVLNNTGPGGTATINLAGILSSIIDIPSPTTGLLSKTNYNSIETVSLTSTDGSLTIVMGDGVVNPTLVVTPLTTPQLVQLQAEGTPVGTANQSINFVSNPSIAWSVTDSGNVYTVSATAPLNAASTWSTFDATQTVNMNNFGLSSLLLASFTPGGTLPVPGTQPSISVYNGETGNANLLIFTDTSAGANTSYYLPFTNVSSPVVGEIFTCTAAGIFGVVTPGTTGYVLTSNGPGQLPSYQANVVATWSTFDATQTVNMNNFGLKATSSIAFNDSGVPTIPNTCLSSYNPSTSFSVPVWTNQTANYYLPLSTVGSPAVGDIPLCSTAGVYSSLGAGTSGYVLTSNGTSSVPSWQPQSGGSGNWSTVTATSNINCGAFDLLNTSNITTGSTTPGDFPINITGTSSALYMERSPLVAPLQKAAGVFYFDSTNGSPCFTSWVDQYRFAMILGDNIPVEGSIPLGNEQNSLSYLAIGANGTVLTSNGTTASWQAGGGGANWSTVTATSNIDCGAYALTHLSGITVGSGNTTPGAYALSLDGGASNAQLYIGNSATPTITGAGGVFTVEASANTPVFTNAGASFNMVLATTPPAIGSILIASSNAVYTPLSIGTSGTVLTSNGTTASWQTLSGGGSYPGVVSAKAAAYNSDPANAAFLPAFTYTADQIQFTAIGPVTSDFTDNVTLNLGDSVAYIDVNTTNAPYSGVYRVARRGDVISATTEVWSRVSTYNGAGNMLPGTLIQISSNSTNAEGSCLANQTFTQLTPGPVNPGVTGLVYSFSGLYNQVSIYGTFTLGVGQAPIFSLPYGRTLVPVSMTVKNITDTFTGAVYPNSTTGTSPWFASTSYSIGTFTTLLPEANVISLTEGQALLYDITVIGGAGNADVLVTGYIT